MNLQPDVRRRGRSTSGDTEINEKTYLILPLTPRLTFNTPRVGLLIFLKSTLVCQDVIKILEDLEVEK